MILSIVRHLFPSFTKKDLEQAFNDYYGVIKNFLYYKTGDLDLSEDLAADVFIKLWENRQKVERETLKSYLYKIAQNLAYNHHKRNEIQLKFEKNHQKDSNMETPHYSLEEREFHDFLEKVISDLPEPSRVVFLMNRMDDLTYKEIADRLNISVKAVEKRMSKALVQIREKLEYKI